MSAGDALSAGQFRFTNKVPPLWKKKSSAANGFSPGVE